MPTFKTNQKHSNLNADLQDAIDVGKQVVLTVGTKFSRLSIETPKEEETTDVR